MLRANIVLRACKKRRNTLPTMVSGEVSAIWWHRLLRAMT